MAEQKISKIEERKKELEEELARIQHGIDDSIDDVKTGVSSNLDPKNIIRKYPLPIVGASVIAGFLLGAESRPSRKASKPRNRNVGDSGISSEIKRILARKGLNMLLDYLDEKVYDIKKKNQPEED